MAAGIPTAMVSSTFFDLRQVRADLVDFIASDAGFQPLLSELDSFPIDTDVDTIENCRRRVEQDADLLVLVIGGRYGSIADKSARSVTNLEYLAAKAKGIPIFSFVKKDVLAALPIWERNPDADFSTVVDTPKLFEFLREVRSIDKIWTREFDTAQEIVSSLRAQFAHLALEGIRWKLKLREPMLSYLSRLQGRTLQVALERPSGWEYLLFMRATRDQLNARHDLRREHELGLLFDSGEYLEDDRVLGWSQMRMEELTRIAGSLTVLFDKPLKEALGPPGKAGNAEQILFVARQIGLAYEAAIKWARLVRTAHAATAWLPVFERMGKLTDHLISEIDEWETRSSAALEDALSRPPGGDPVELNLILKIELAGDTSEVVSEMERAARARGMLRG
jgi:hypothetical protein